MPTLPPTGDEKDATISFRCDPQWKRDVAKWAIDHGTTMQALCTKAIARLTGIKPAADAA